MHGVDVRELQGGRGDLQGIIIAGGTAAPGPEIRDQRLEVTLNP